MKTEKEKMLSGELYNASRPVACLGETPGQGPSQEPQRVPRRRATEESGDSEPVARPSGR